MQLFMLSYKLSMLLPCQQNMLMSKAAIELGANTFPRVFC